MERQIAILICVVAIIGFGVALHKNNSLSSRGLLFVTIIAAGLGGILALTL